MKFRATKDKGPSVQHDDKDLQHQDSGRKQHVKLSPRIVVTVEDLQKAELLRIKTVQCRAFPEEMKALEVKQQRSDLNGKVKKVTKRSIPIHRLDPFLDKDGILRVGGRILEAGVPYVVKHPAILPKRSHVTDLVIRHFHQRTAHPGHTTKSVHPDSGY